MMDIVHVYMYIVVQRQNVHSSLDSLNANIVENKSLLDPLPNG